MAEKYTVFYGTILLQLSSSLSKELQILWDEGKDKNAHFYDPYYNKVFLLQKELANVLSKTPDICNVQWVDEPHKKHFEPFDDYNQPNVDYLMQLSSPIKFDVFLPVSKREYQLPIYYEEKVTQHFSVIYNGVVFMAYAPIENDLNEGKMLGPEIREILVKVLSCDLWQAHIIAPCPLRMKFYIQSKAEKLNGKSELKIFGEIVDDVCFDSTEQLSAIALNLFFQNCLAIEYFSSIMTLKQKMDQSIWLLESLYDEVKNDFNDVIIGKTGNRKIKTIRKKVFELHTLLYDYDRSVYKFSTHNKSFNELIYERGISRYLIDYFIHELQITNYNQTNILNSLDYIEERLRENKSNFYVMFSAIAGAMIGIFISYIPNIVHWISNIIHL